MTHISTTGLFFSVAAMAATHSTTPVTFNKDLILEMPQAFVVPSVATIEYQYFVLSGRSTKDTWVTAAEVRPSNKQAVNHPVIGWQGSSGD